MNILLIGSSKFIGSHLLDRLVLKNEIEKIFCTYFSNNQSKRYKDKKLTFAKCDVRKLLNVKKNLIESDADIIIYMASTRYFPSPTDINDHLDININGIRNLIESCKIIKKNPKIKNPYSQRDLIYIDDVIDIIEKVTFSNQKIYSIDVGSSNPLSTLDIIKEIYKVMSVKKQIQVGKIENKEDITYMKADLSVAKSKFNWSPKTDLKEGLSSTIEWIKGNMNYYD